MDIKDQALTLISESKDGVYQNDLWKLLEIDSRKCSRILYKLIDEGLVERENAVNNGSSTYLIKTTAPKEDNLDLLLAGNMFSPCAGCRIACQPEYCDHLFNWVNKLSEKTVVKE